MLIRNDCVPDLYKKKSSRARVACGNRLSNFGFRKPIKSKSLHQSSSGILLALDVVDQISWKIKLVRHCVDQGRQSDTQESTWDLRFIRQLFWHDYQSLATEPFNEFPPWLSKSIVVGWIPPPSLDGRTQVVRSLHRQPDSPARARTSTFFLLFFSLGC